MHFRSEALGGPTLCRSLERFLHHFKVSSSVLMALTTLVFCPDVQSQVPELLYLRLNGGIGNTVNDKAMPGVPGTSVVLHSGVGWQSSNPAVGSASLITDNVVGIPGDDIAYTNAPFNYSGDWTIEFWARRSGPFVTNSGAHPLLGKPGATSIVIDHDPAAPIHSLSLTGPGVNKVSLYGVGLQNLWQHFAFVHDCRARTITPFVNGNSKVPVVQPGSIDLNGDALKGLLFGGVVQNEWEGELDEIRVWSRTLAESEIQAGKDNHVNAVSGVDVAVVEVVSPSRFFPYVGQPPYSANEVVSVRVENLGLSVLPTGTVIPLSFSVDGGLILATEVLTLVNPLVTGESVHFTFNSTVDLSGSGVLIIEVTSNLIGDSQPSNNTKARVLAIAGREYIAEYPYFEDFTSAAVSTNTPPAGWRHPASNMAEDWIFTSDPSMIETGFFPIQGDHTTGVSGAGLAAMVPSSFLGNSIKLDGPVFDLTINSNPRLDFWVWSTIVTPFQATASNIFNLDVISQPSGAVIAGVGGPWVGNPFVGTVPSSSDWFNIGVDLGAFSGQAIRLRFRVDGSPNNVNHAILIDDVRLTDHPIGLGQPPQPGLAVLDLNGAQSPGGLAVRFVENGPYSSVATPGGLLDFSFEGPADQPILLLVGPMNLVAASFSNVGQMDIGGSPDPITGIPSSIGVLFDGTSLVGLNPLFRTNIMGVASLGLTMPNVPPGILTTFQAVILNDTPSGIALSNAIELEIQ